MSSTVNVGGQQIGWKFSTPLQADYLNTFGASIYNPGLLTRPKIDVQTQSSGATIIIHPFSLIIEPNDKIVPQNLIVDENGNKIIQKVVKMSTTTDVSLSIGDSTIAIGFEYSFSNNGIPQSQWYGSFVVLDKVTVRTFKGVIIAVVQMHNIVGKRFICRTNGADISDVLLASEGWNPYCWLSFVSPRRMIVENGGTGYFNQFELRSHNNLWSGYVNGHAGCVKQSNLRWNIPIYEPPQGSEEIGDLTGEMGLNMPAKFCLFRHNSEGLALCDYSNEFPISETSGSVFAVADATYTTKNQSGYSPQANTAFACNIRLYPVNKEDVNIYFKDTNGENTIYIK